MIKNLKCFRDLTQKNIDKKLNFRQCAVCLHQNNDRIRSDLGKQMNTLVFKHTVLYKLQ